MAGVQRRLLRSRNVALFVSVSLVSGFAGTVMSLTAGVWVKSLTGSSSLAGLAALCLYLPTLLGPALGIAVDRLARRPLLVWTNVVCAATLLLLLAVSSADDVWLVYLVMLARGVGYVLEDAGEAALLPQVVPAESLGHVNGVRMSAQESTKLLGPVAGAGLFAWAGGPAVATLAAALLIITAGLYAGIRMPPSGPHRQPRQEPGALAFWDGLRFVRSNPRTYATVLVASTSMLMSGIGTAAVFAVVDEGLHRPAAFMGVLASLQGVGSIAGGLGAGWLLHRLGTAGFGAVGALLFSVGAAAQSVAWLPAVVGASVIIGVGLPWTIVAAMTAIQRQTPAHLMGRVAATANSMMFGPPALGIPIGAAALALVDYRVPLAVAAAGSLFAGACLLARQHALERVDQVDAHSSMAPPTARR